MMTSRVLSALHGTLLAAVFMLATPPSAHAQEDSGLQLGVGVGGTYYCILSRCDTGSTLTALLGYDLPGPFTIEGTVRRHRCFDCDRFWIGEGSLRFELPGIFLGPSLAAGVGVVSDPEFLQERKLGPHLALGLSLPSLAGLGVRLDIRGRQVGFGSGDYMGEAALLLLYRP
jgi:hypothetical protein